MGKEQFPQPANESEKDIQGEGFVIKKGDLPKSKRSQFNDSVRVEFRPGETTDTARERRDREREQERKAGHEVKHQSNAEFMAEHFAEMLGSTDKNEYSETLAINSDGRLNLKQRIGDTAPPYVTAGLEARELPDDLYKLMQEIQDAHPEYRITFENDPHGKWIRYTVKRVNKK